MNVTFEQIVKDSMAQPVLERLIMLFAKIEKEGDDDEGYLHPVLTFDMLPEDFVSFDALLKEADSHNSSWDFIIVGVVTGSENTPPNPDIAESYLGQMIDNLNQGKNLDQYLVFDRAETLVQLDQE